MSDDVCSIRQLLEDLGYGSGDAARVARAMLEAEGLTNSRKSNIHASKVKVVSDLLSASLARSCGAAYCSRTLALSGRGVVVGAPSSCELCGGSEAVRCVREMADRLLERGLRALLVVGASPNASQAIRTALTRTGVEVAFVDGLGRLPQARAKQLAGWADVVVIWAPAQLGHAVSQNISRFAGRRTIYVTERGVTSLARTVVGRVDGWAA